MEKMNLMLDSVYGRTQFSVKTLEKTKTLRNVLQPYLDIRRKVHC